MRWPAIRGPRRSTGAWEHARSVWQAAGVHASLVRTQGKADAGLAFIGHLSGHVVGCRTCGARWIEGDMPVEYLERALEASTVRDIWRAAVREERGRESARARRAAGKPVRRARVSAA